MYLFQQTLGYISCESQVTHTSWSENLFFNQEPSMNQTGSNFFLVYIHHLSIYQPQGGGPLAMFVGGTPNKYMYI